MPYKVDNRVRPEHEPVGDGMTCDRCGIPASVHRVRNRTRGEERPRPEHDFDGFGEFCGICRLPEHAHRQRKRSRPGRKNKVIFFGIDGEGQGRQDHKYVLLAVSNSDGTERYHVENPYGLTTDQCLEFISSLPSYVRLFCYSFNYDLTKMLENVGDREIHELARPENRQRYGKDWFKGPRSVGWQKWSLNMQATKFYFKRKGLKRSTIIWDIWKFYQSKFTNACDDWKVGTKEEIKHMRYMKDHRHEFDKLPKDQVREYCFQECQFMAQLAEKLTSAHEDCGLKLKTYYGAGSTASAILKKLNIPDYIKPPPKEMEMAVAMAFSGGRFDNAFIGKFEGTVYSYDISSAYPYQIFQLPCLAHGTWERVNDKSKIYGANAALIRYRTRVVTVTKDNKHWGPFPYRDAKGNICYPIASEGWVWRDEFLAAEEMFDGVEFLEAWVYNKECDCHPFKEVPKFYIERCLIGKEGPGIVLKLGINSIYGKIAQSIGKAIYRSWIWAGIITSGCRAQVLRAMALHRDRGNLLMIATDGILTRERLDLPKPIDTGTYGVWECEKHKKTCFECEDKKFKPLGGWEEKIVNRGIFLARPGVYFPLNPTEDDIKTVRGRGVGRGVILNHWEAIVNTWEQWDKVLRPESEGFDKKGWPTIKVSNVSRFCGMKTSISRRVADDIRDGFIYKRADGDHLDPFKPAPRYGQWVDRQVLMSFDPDPKRSGLEPDGALTLHSYAGYQSEPYKKAVVSPEARALMSAELIALEQPEYDPVDYSYLQDG